MTSPLLLKLISPHFIHLVLQLTSGKTTKQYQTSPNIFKHLQTSETIAANRIFQGNPGGINMTSAPHRHNHAESNAPKSPFKDDSMVLT